MSYFDRIETSFTDNGQVDAGGRLRVSTLETILEGKFYYDKQPLLVEDLISGSASSTHLTDSTINMEVGNTIGDRIVRQTKNYSQYQPGKSQRIFMTGVLNSNPTVGIRSRIGYFDDKNDKSVGLLRGNGLFFQLDGTQFSIGLRKTDPSTLTQTDDIVPQSSWNVDKFDGTGPSGVTIDPSKTLLFVIDFIWLGVGRVRFGFIYEGILYYCHEIKNSDNITTYMNTPSLPIRYEIENTGGVTNTSVLKQICYSVMSEGGYQTQDIVRSVDRGITVLTATTTLLPAIAIRLKDDPRSALEILQVMATNISGNRNIRWGLYLNPILTGGTWVNIDHSITQVNSTATEIDITNSVLLDSGYVIADQTSEGDTENQLLAYKDIAGVSDIICLAFQTTSSAGDVIGGLKFKEIY